MAGENNELADKLIRLGTIEVLERIESKDFGIPNDDLMCLGFLLLRFGIQSAGELKEILKSSEKLAADQKKRNAAWEKLGVILSNPRERSIP